MSRPGQFGPDEARKILERAAQIQAEDEGRAGDVSTGDLAAAAEQVGISNAALVRAIAEARGVESKPDRVHYQTRAAVEARLHLHAPVTDAAVERVWDLVIREHGGLGEVEVQGNTKVWRPKSGGDGVEVRVRQGEASTEVWLREPNRALEQTWLPFAVLGGMFVAGLRNPISLLFGAVAFFTVRWLVRAWKGRQLSSELDRQLDQIEAELLRPDPQSLTF